VIDGLRADLLGDGRQRVERDDWTVLAAALEVEHRQGVRILLELGRELEQHLVLVD
jgi:hypothetical protein